MNTIPFRYKTGRNIPQVRWRQVQERRQEQEQGQEQQQEQEQGQERRQEQEQEQRQGEKRRQEQEQVRERRQEQEQEQERRQEQEQVQEHRQEHKQEQGQKQKQGQWVPYLTFPLLEDTGLVAHAFSTRLGGVSTGKFATMNFAVSRGDDPAHVRENYWRMAEAIGVDEERIVLAYQTHTTNVRKVTEEDAGKGIVRERDYRDVDGLITDVPGITLVTFYADCVPLYFLDPVHRAIGLSHSGWRGTAARMGRVTLEAMAREYKTVPADVLCCIGPGICRDCFEVGPEVIDEFRAAFDERYWKELFYAKENGKYQLDLWKANEIILLEAGVPQPHIQVTDLCTRCNPEYLFSHRFHGEERGNLAAFLCLNHS